MENQELTIRLERCYGGVIYDAMRKAGYADCVLPYDIKGIDRNNTVAGLAFTLEGKLEPGVDIEECLLKWTEFLSKAPAGAVVVCQPNDMTVAHMGELSAEALQFRNVKGYVVDGGCRDTEHILKIGFPVFCKYLTPKDIVGTWVPTAIQQPIKIGNIQVTPNDYIFGDMDGVVVIPQEIAQEIVSDAEEKMNTEDLVRKAILEGVDPQDAYLKYGAF